MQTTQTICTVGVVLIAAGIFCGWVLPGVARALPHDWALMKVNTSVAFLLGAAALFTTQASGAGARLVVGRLCCVAIMIIAGSALFAYSTGTPIGFETVLGADSGAEQPGRMSVQTAVYLELAGLILVLGTVPRQWLTHLADALTMMLVLLVLIVVAGYIFDAGRLFGQSVHTRVAPQTLACMSLLGVAVVCRRTRDGFFAVLVGQAIGSQAARVTLPLATTMPFLIVSLSAFATRAHWLSTPYAAGLAASLCSILIFGFVVLMAGKTNALERELRDMSLTDELTKIHNRRAFYVLGEHALREARRDHRQLTVLYFDLNGLKRINDELGHEVGSRLLIEAAHLLQANFRRSDIVARVGGDEFAIVGRQGRTNLIAAITRLDVATAAVNRTPGIPYRISYSMGEATYDPGSGESFVELVERADAMMYERKRSRAAAREAASRRDTSKETMPDHMATGVMATYVPQKDLRSVGPSEAPDPEQPLPADGATN